jgi:adenosine deaminase
MNRQPTTPHPNFREPAHEQDFYDLATAYFTKAAAQNVRYAEIFFDPQAHTSRGVEFGTVLRGLRRAVVDARRTLDLHASLIMCFLRDYSAEYAMATLMESLPYKDWIVGVGLDSDERGNPPVVGAALARARTTEDRHGAQESQIQGRPGYGRHPDPGIGKAATG